MNLDVELVSKEDLDLKNHLSGIQGKFIKLTFDSVDEMAGVLGPIRQDRVNFIIRKNFLVIIDRRKKRRLSVRKAIFLKIIK